MTQEPPSVGATVLCPRSSDTKVRLWLQQNLADDIMARKSPPLAFEPSTALDDNKENHTLQNRHFSPDNNRSGRGEARDSTKAVHFSPVTSPARRAHSLATATVPYLDPIPSASQLPRSSSNSQYIPLQTEQSEASRNLYEKQREIFESERSLFEEERKLWRTERTILLDRIAELELRGNNNKQPQRRHSNDSAGISPKSTRADLGLSSRTNGAHGSRAPSSSSSGPPVWERPEGSGTVTRVFSNEEQSRNSSGHMPSIAEDGPSPEREEANTASIRIEEIDSKLDGINLRSSIPNPSFNRILSRSPSASPRASSSPRSKPASDHGLQINVDGLLTPGDSKLKLYAGHTPMAMQFSEGEGSVAEDDDTAEAATPRQELPRAPKQSIRPSVSQSIRPSERALSYFPQSADTGDDGEEDEDPELKGQLSMNSEHKEGKENSFLDQLDAKLLMEAKKILGSGSGPAAAREGEKGEEGEQKITEDELESLTGDAGSLKLKIKQSMNFGSAFGSSKPGKM